MKIPATSQRVSQKLRGLDGVMRWNAGPDGPSSRGSLWSQIFNFHAEMERPGSNSSETESPAAWSWSVTCRSADRHRPQEHEFHTAATARVYSLIVRTTEAVGRSLAIGNF
jgi:hypothetical protein